MMTIRVTVLEAFRRMLLSASEYDTEEAFIETLTGQFGGNEKTRIGTVFHRIVGKGIGCLNKVAMLEPFPYTEPTVLYLSTVDGYTITLGEQHVHAALGYRQSIRNLFSDIPSSKVYPARHGDIMVTATIPVLDGLFIRSAKTRYRPFKSTDYTGSYQWRFYLDMGESSTFYHDVFEFKGYPSNYLTHNVSGLSLVRHDPIECLRYNDMDSDLRYLLGEFQEYIRFRKLQWLVSG